MPRRGKLTVLDTGKIAEFMFNPIVNGDTQSSTWTDQPCVGHESKLQYGGRGKRKISLNVYLDGDRGRDHARRIDARSNGVSSTSVKDDINFYWSLYAPRRNISTDIPRIKPPKLIFDLGDLYANLPCYITNMSVQVAYFNNNLDPVRATITLELTIDPIVELVSEDYFR